MLSTKMIGNKIYEARKKNNLSQAQLAEQVSISPQAVGKWERGESMPDISTLNKLAKILGVDLNYFSATFKSNENVELSETDEIQSADNSSSSKKSELNWNMSSGSWVDADFSELNKLQDKFSSSNMKNCKFTGSNLSDLTLKSNDIADCDFSKSDMRNSKIQYCDFVRNNFTECSLIDSIFSTSEIQKCDFSKANFSGVEFKKSEFNNCTLVNTIWNQTSFKMSHISNLIFNGKIEECSFENCSFSKVTFQNATLTNTFFKGQRLKGIKFIDCQADRMTYEFLKNGKADLNGITLKINENDSCI